MVVSPKDTSRESKNDRKSLKRSEQESKIRRRTTEGVLSYKLKFPFNEFVNSNILMARAAQAYEPKQTLINQGLQGNDNENLQIGALKSYEPQILDKNQEVTLENATSLQIGDAVSSHRELV